MLDELLAAWISRQRWFGGKGRAVDRLSVESDVTVDAGDPGLRHLIISVWQGGSRERYQILLGMRGELPDQRKHALIGSYGPYAFDGGPARDDWYVYDAVHDQELTRRLLERMSDGHDQNGVRFRHLDGVTIDTSLRSLVLGAEQSNTSLVYGDAYICKLFRRLIPGVNPELEIVTALAARARVLVGLGGWLMGAGRYGESRTVCEEAAGTAMAAGAPAEEARARSNLGSDLASLGDIAGGIEQLEEACRLGETHGLVDTLLVARANLAYQLLVADRFEEAIAAAEAGREAATRYGLLRRYGAHFQAVAIDGRTRRQNR